MLFLRGLWWRRGYSAAVLVVGVIATAVAALGPVYARAAGESTLHDALVGATYRTGLAYGTRSLVGERSAVPALRRAIGAAIRPFGYGAAIADLSVPATAKAQGASASTLTTVVSRTGVCAHVTMVSGRCPRSAGEAMVDEDAADDGPHWRVGQRLRLRQAVFDFQGLLDGSDLPRARIVGVYRPRDIDEAYWFNASYFVSRFGPVLGGAALVGVDPVFVAPAQFTRPVPVGQFAVEDRLEIDVPLVPGAVRLDDLPRLRRAVRAAQRRFPPQSTRTRPALRTELATALADAARDRRAVDTATLVVVLELSLLGLLVLFQVVGGAVAARGDEIALAKLRGLPPWRVVVFALREPVLLLVLAAPLGFGLGVGVAAALTSAKLADGTPVSVRGPAFVALAVALAGAAVAAGLGAARTIRRPVLEQWRNTAPVRRGTRVVVVGEVLIAVLAVVAAVVLRRHGAGRTALIAPALLVLAVALLGVRLLPLVGRAGLSPTRASHRIALFLALRQTVRRPSGLRLAALLAVAAGLATFAICGEAVAAANRDARAQTELGAPRVLSVQFGAAHDPETAVQRADPRGRWAMATARWVPDGSTSATATITGPLLGVDPARLRSVGYSVRGELGARVLAAAVDGGSPPPALFRGRSLAVTLDATPVSGDHPSVTLVYRHRHDHATTAPGSTLRTGVATYRVAVDCTTGCTFEGVIIDRSIDATGPSSGRVTITAVSSDGRRVPVRLTTARDWRSDSLGVGARSTFTPTASGMQAAFSSDGGASPTLTYADSPTVVPVVAAPKSLSSPARRGVIADYSTTSLPYRLSRVATPLPAVLDTGAIANLDYLRTRLPRFDAEATWSVWLGPHAPRDAVARLARAGLIVQSRASTSARVDVLARQGPALGLLLLLVCAVAAAVLAVGGTAVSLLADARRRSFELAALRVIGVSRRSLRRSAVTEQALLLGTALVLGVPGGYLAAALTLSAVPEFSDPTPVVLRYTPPVLVALACAGACALLLWVTATVAGRALVRSAVPSRLREAAR